MITFEKFCKQRKLNECHFDEAKRWRSIREDADDINEGLYDGDQVKDDDYEKVFTGAKGNITDKKDDKDFVTKGNAQKSGAVMLTVSGIAGQKMADGKTGKMNLFLLNRNITPNTLAAMGVDNPEKAKISDFKVVSSEKGLELTDGIYKAAVEAGFIKDGDNCYVNIIW